MKIAEVLTMKIIPLKTNTHRISIKQFAPCDWRPNPIWIVQYRMEQSARNHRKARRVIAMAFIGLAIAAATIAVGNASTKAIAELALHNVIAAQKDQ